MILGKELERCKAVLVNGRNQVVEVAEGYEAMLWARFCYNHWNDKSTLYVFGDDDRLIFTSDKSKGVPDKVPNEENLKFNDLFVPA